VLLGNEKGNRTNFTVHAEVSMENAVCHVVLQVRQERSEWQQLASATGPWLKSRVLTEQDLFYALCLVR
jgi:hypothetical protein